MERLLQDLRFAVRSLSRDRSFSLISLSTLALGIAATVTALAVTKSVLLNPLPYANGERMIEIILRESPTRVVQALDAQTLAARPGVRSARRS